jgi:hypothetical protein
MGSARTPSMTSAPYRSSVLEHATSVVADSSNDGRLAIAGNGNLSVCCFQCTDPAEENGENRSMKTQSEQ